MPHHEPTTSHRLNSQGQENTVSYQESLPSTSDRYEIRRRVAAGGLGVVFVAVDTAVRRDVALKCIRQDLADNESLQAKFRRETEITGGLEHPYIIPIYAAGESVEGRPFYAMRFIDGVDLRVAIKQFHKLQIGPCRNSIEFRKLVAHFVDVCNAIDYAHSQGVIHRDIKPHNIMLGNFGETYVVDWGLAKKLANGDSQSFFGESERTSSEQTRNGSEVGTRGYMSPEQAEGDIENTGKASDIYGLGATLYCLIANRPPIIGHDKTGDFLVQVRNGSFPKLREVNASAPPALESICAKALATDPKDRYPTPGALAVDVEAWLADEPVGVHAESISESVRRWGRNRLSTIFAGCIALIFLTGFGAWAYSLQLARASDRSLLANSYIHRGASECESGSISKGLVRFREAVSLAGIDTVVGKSAQRQIDAWLDSREFRMPQPTNVIAVGHSTAQLKLPELVHTLAVDGTLSSWSVSDRSLHRILPLAKDSDLQCSSAAFSQDGSKLVVGWTSSSSNRACFAETWDLLKDEIEGVAISDPQIEHQKIATACWIGNDRVALGAESRGMEQRDGTLAICSVKTVGAEKNKVHVIRTGFRKRLKVVTAAPNGKFILACSRGGEWSLWDADATGAASSLVKGIGGGLVESATFSPQSDEFWIALRNQRERSIGRWTICDDGRQVKTTRITYPMPHQRGELKSIARKNAGGQSLLLTTGRDFVRWWDVSSSPRLIGERPQNSTYYAAFAGDGIVAGREDGIACFWQRRKEVWRAKTLNAVPTMLCSDSRNDVVAVGFGNGQVETYRFDKTGPQLALERVRSVPNPNDSRMRVTYVELNSSGTRLAIAAECVHSDPTNHLEIPSIVQLWSLEDDPPRQICNGIQSEEIVFAVGIHPDDSTIVTGGGDKNLTFWDAETLEERFSLAAGSTVYSIAFDQSGQTLGVGTANSAKLYAWGSNEDYVNLPHKKRVDSVAFGRVLGVPVFATGSADNRTQIWDAKTGELQDSLRTEGGVVRILIDPREPTIVSSLTDSGSIRRWDTSVGTSIGPKAESLLQHGKDLCVGRGWQAAIADGDKTLYFRSVADTRRRSNDDVARIMGGRVAANGRWQQLAYDQWIELFQDHTEKK